MGKLPTCHSYKSLLKQSKFNRNRKEKKYSELSEAGTIFSSISICMRQTNSSPSLAGFVMTQQAFTNNEHYIAKTRRRWLHSRWEAKKISNEARLELLRVIGCKIVPVKPAIEGLKDEAKAMLAELETKEGHSLEVSQRARQGTFIMAGYELEPSGTWWKVSSKLEATERKGNAEVMEENMDRKRTVEPERFAEDVEGPVPMTPCQESEEFDNVE